MDERSGLHIVEGGSSCSMDDPGISVGAEVDGRSADLVAQHDCLVLGIDLDDLSIDIGGGRRDTDAYVAREYLMMALIEHGIHRDALTFFDRKLSGLSAIVKDVGPLIEPDLPASTAKDAHGHPIADVVYAADSSTDERGLAIG